jgi:hypothetical protein
MQIYPYMLHREPDRKNQRTFRQISGLNEPRGISHPHIREEALCLAQETIAYELAWLSQMIDFYTAAKEWFEQKNTRHNQSRLRSPNASV